MLTEFIIIQETAVECQQTPHDKSVCLAAWSATMLLVIRRPHSL